MKWQMIWALMTEAEPLWQGIWQGIREGYDYIMVADDDLIMDACTIDILFDVSPACPGQLPASCALCRCWRVLCASARTCPSPAELGACPPARPGRSPCGATSCWWLSPPIAVVMTATTPTGELSRGTTANFSSEHCQAHAHRLAG
jgi:hypothetical protein